MSKCTPPLTLCIPPPPNCDMVCLQDLGAWAPPDHSFFPYTWHLATPRWWEDLGIAPFHPTIQPKVHISDITHPTFYSNTSLQWYRGASCAPPAFHVTPPSAPNPFQNLLMGLWATPTPRRTGVAPPSKHCRSSPPCSPTRILLPTPWRITKPSPSPTTNWTRRPTSRGHLGWTMQWAGQHCSTPPPR